MSIEQEIDRIADDFEAAWQTDQPLELVDYFKRIAPDHRDRLLDVLVPLDIT